jgi:hypothetical protein
MAAAPRSDARQPSATRLEPASAAVPSAAKHQKDDNNDEKRGGIQCASFSAAFDQKDDADQRSQTALPFCTISTSTKIAIDCLWMDEL